MSGKNEEIGNVIDIGSGSCQVQTNSVESTSEDDCHVAEVKRQPA